MYVNKFRTEIFGIIREAMFWTRNCIERLTKVFTEFLHVKITRNRIKRIKVANFKTKLIRNAVLRENFGYESVDGDATHASNMHAARNRLFIANKKLLSVARSARVSYFACYPVCPEHWLMLSRHLLYGVGLLACRGFKCEGIAFLLTHQCGAQRRHVREFLNAHICLLAPDNRVFVHIIVPFHLY